MVDNKIQPVKSCLKTKCNCKKVKAEIQEELKVPDPIEDESEIADEQNTNDSSL